MDGWIYPLNGHLGSIKYFVNALPAATEPVEHPMLQNVSSIRKMILRAFVLRYGFMEVLVLCWLMTRL